MIDYLMWHIDGEIEALQLRPPVDGPARGELLLQLGVESLRRTDYIRHLVAPVVVAGVAEASPPRAEAASAIVTASGHGSLSQQLHIALPLAEGKAIHIHKVRAILSRTLVVHIWYNNRHASSS